MRLHRMIPQFFGYDLINIKRNLPTLETHLAKLLPLLGIDLVVDAGANAGQFGRMLRSIGYQNEILSFEPVLAAYEQLAKTALEDEKWEAIKCALGSEEGTQKIHVTSDTVFSSFRQPNQYAYDFRSEELASGQAEEVETRRLDLFLSQRYRSNVPNRIFLKMDTQGYDLEVFAGAKNIFPKIVGLQSEVSITPLYENMPSYVDAITEFRNAGFELTGFYPITRDFENMLLVEADCVMRRIEEIGR